MFGSNVHSHKQREVSWHPPIGNSIKVNVDGSSFGNPGRAGFGGCIRNSCGEWISGFSGTCGCTSNINAELLAICHGLNKAWWQAGYSAIIIESDSKSALEMISEGVTQFHPHAPLVTHIRSLISRQW